MMRLHAGYSGEVTAFQVIKAGLQTGYRAVVAAVLGPYALGLYMLGYKLSVETTAVFRAGLGGFLFPFLSRHQDDRAALVGGFVRATKSLLGLTSLALAGMVLTAPYLVPFVFGEEWTRAAVAAQVLTLVALADCVFGTSGELMKATRHSRGLLVWSLAYAVVMLSLLVVGAVTAGLVGAAWGAGLAALLLVPVSLVQAGRRLAVRPTWLARQLLVPVSGPLLVTVTALLVSAMAPDVPPAVIVPLALTALLLLGHGQLRALRSTGRT
ncbi:MAG: oligosaccharide flippase family protein [Nocardioidaceae bacterium]|nr:oligosaccharide flippase family protein [Nocardioidaceae bacterium]